MEVRISLSLDCWAADEDCLRSASRAAKYAVGVNLVFCSERVSSIEDKTTVVCAG